MGESAIREVENSRVFDKIELDGFYVGDGLCVHITFEDEETIAIDLFDDERAARDGNIGDVIAQPVILNIRTGTVERECPVSSARCADYKESCHAGDCWLKC